MENFKGKLEQLAALIQSQQLSRLETEGYTVAVHQHNYLTKIAPGRKYTKIDIGPSGKYMVDNVTGEIFGIKGYGVIHRGHQYGTLDTIHEWDWSGYNAHRITTAKAATSNPRIFSGVYPCGIVYADRQTEVAGDYKRLAFLDYATLTLEVEKDAPLNLVSEIRADAALIQARRGEQFQISSCNQTVLLGSKLSAS